ncbi:LysR family transcriptional regulator [Pigmentiphaga aceris]|nr:LysR family transcriptional regulator [Pigmentiphaga aceris]
MSIERFNGVRAFVQAAQAGSFSEAARQLGQSPSSIGKAISRLEQRLDVRLFHRTTRSLSLTDEGLAFHRSCVLALDELEHAEAALSARRHMPAGRLRIALPVLFGRYQVMPILLKLMQVHPALELEAVFSNRPVDFAEEGIDLAVRIGALEDSPSLAARRIGAQGLVVCAAASYVARRGLPLTRDALADHDCIGMLRDGRIEPWRFDTVTKELPVTPRLRLGDLESVLAAMRAGHGFAQLPTWLVATELANGELVAALPQQAADKLPIHAIWPASRAMSARLRVTIDALRVDAGSLPRN